jgi:hypothetical protein
MSTKQSKTTCHWPGVNKIKCAGNQTLHICNLDNQYNMVRGVTINTDQSHNHAQSKIETHGHTSITRHHNRSRKVRRENQQQEALGEPKKMHGHHQKLKTMMMKIRQVMIVKYPLVQDQF